MTFQGITIKKRDMILLLFIALSFDLTGAGYLAWVNRLVALVGAPLTDWLSMIAGYLLQAAGLGLTVGIYKKNPRWGHEKIFIGAVILFPALGAPAMVAASPWAGVAFGLVMNLICGVIAGYYLCALHTGVDGEKQGFAFGGGYALATALTGLLALIGAGTLLDGRPALGLCALLALGLVLLTRGIRPFDAGSEASEPPRETPLALALAAAMLISAVKNLGFGFPSADIAAGLQPAVSRIPYAIGLAAAGLIGDRSRPGGMLCAAAALVTPFIMLGLQGEAVSGAVFWGLDYLFYGFFSVFRALCFLDLARRAQKIHYAPLGLLAGRVGDAAGTALGLVLSGRKIILIAACAALFIPAVILLFRLYQRLYMPKAAAARSEQEVFEAFCLHNDLSARERDIFRLIIDGRTNGEIAEALFISENTVKYHVRNVLQKTGCKGRGELQAKYKLALYPSLDQVPKSLPL